MTSTDPSRYRETLLWQIRDIMTRVRPEDMTDSELSAVVAILGRAEARLPGNKPTFQIQEEQR